MIKMYDQKMNNNSPNKTEVESMFITYLLRDAGLRQMVFFNLCA